MPRTLYDVSYPNTPTPDIPAWLKFWRGVTPWQEEQGQTYPQWAVESNKAMGQGIKNALDWYQQNVVKPISAYGSLGALGTPERPGLPSMGQAAKEGWLTNPQEVIRQYEQWKAPWGTKGMTELMVDPLMWIPGGQAGKAGKGAEIAPKLLEQAAKFAEKYLARGEFVENIIRGIGKTYPEVAPKARQIVEGMARKLGISAEKVAPKIPEVAPKVKILPQGEKLLKDIATNESKGVSEGTRAFWENGIGTTESHSMILDSGAEEASIRLEGLSKEQIAKLEELDATGAIRFTHKPDFPLSPYTEISVAGDKNSIAQQFKNIADDLSKISRGEVAPKVGGIVPPSRPPTGGGGLSDVESMWGKGRQKPPKDIPDAYLKLQEQINDATFGLRRLQGQIEKESSILRGGEKDVKTLLTRSPGVANAGATRYMLTVNEIKRVAPDVGANDINTIIYSNHAKEVITEKGVERVMAGGFKTTEELDAVLAQLQSKLGADKFNRAWRGAEVVKRVYGEELDRLVQSGLISKELGGILKAKYPWYNPLQYVDDAEKLVAQGKSAKPYTVISSGLKRLTEKGTEKAARSPLDVMADQLVKNEVRIHKNETSRAIVQLALDEPKLGVTKVSTIRPVAQVGEETVFRPYKGEIPGTLSYFENGVRQVYRVPDWIYREADTLTKTISNPVASLIGSLNGISRAAFTTVSPPFVVSNMLNDSLTAFIRGGILPHETGMRLIRSLRGLTNDKIMQSFRLSGGYQMRFYGKDLARQVIKDGGMVLKPNESILTKIWKFIPEAGEAGEQAPRMALFEKQLNKTLPTWKSMTVEEIAKTPQARAAAADAVELTINFGRGGYLVKAANPFVIFLNASMEGAKLPFRALRDIPAARFRLAGVGAGLMGLTTYNLSYPEYFDIPNSTRWGSVVVMLPSKGKDEYGQTKPNYLTIIPRTREWGLFFGTTTYAMEKLFADSPTEFGKFAAVMAPQLSPIAEVPVPEVIAELSEQAANWDFYYSEPIIPTWQKNLPPEEQTSKWVSPTIEKIANTLNISPTRLQHATQGLFGGAGQAILSVPDYIANLISGKEQKGIPVVSSIVKRVYPERGGQLYKTAQEDIAKEKIEEQKMERTLIPTMDNLVKNPSKTEKLRDEIGDEQYLEALKYYRSVYGNKITNEVSTPGYMALSDKDKKTRISSIQSDAQDEMIRKYQKTEIVKPLTPTQQYNRASTTIEDNIWAQYPPNLRQISDQIIKLENSDNRNDKIRARQLLMQHPEILSIRRKIAIEKARIKREIAIQGR